MSVPAPIGSDQFADFVRQDRQCDAPASRRALRQGLCEIRRLLRLDLRRHGRLVRVDRCFDQDRPRRSERYLQRLRAGFRIVDAKGRQPEALRDGREVDRLKLALIFRMAEKDHLLPFDLAEHIVLDDDDFDVEIVFDERGHLADEHGEAAIAHEANDLPVGIRDGSRDRVGQAAGHRREIARAGELHVAADLQVARGPSGDRAGIGRDDRVILQEFVQLMRHHLRLHRTVGSRAALFQKLVPRLHATLRLLEEAAVLAHRKLRQERVEHGGGVADQRTFDRRTQADALRIMVDLDDARLTRLGIELDIGE